MIWIAASLAAGFGLFALGPEWIIWLMYWPARRLRRRARLMAEEEARQADYAEVRLQEWKLN